MNDEFYSIDGRLFDKQADPQVEHELNAYQRSLPIIEEVTKWLEESIEATHSVDYILLDEHSDPLDIKAQLLAQKYLRFKLLDKQAEFLTRFENLKEAADEKRKKG